MERILVTPGLSFIGCQIFSGLDLDCLKKCRLVCQLWNDFLVVHKFYWKCFYVKIRQSNRRFRQLVRWHPEWETVFCHFERCQSLEESKLFLKIMHRYHFKEENIHPYDTTPFHLAVSNGELEEVQMLLPHLNQSLAPDDDASCVGFLTAAENGQEVVLQLMLNEAQERSIWLIQSIYGQTALNLASANGHQKVVKLILEEAKNHSDCQIDTKISFGLAYDKKHLETMKIIFCAAELRTKFSMVFFVLCQAIQSVQNIMVKKRMSLMLFFFFVVLGIFILSVHLRKVN